MNTEADLPKAASFPGSGILPVAPFAELDGTSAQRETSYAPGQILAGKYRVERRIGEGAMGQVLAVTHLGLNETLAMKIIRPEARELPDVLSRFGKEAKLAARIKSEHVIRVFDVDDAQPMGAYMVMEYLEGQSLGELLEACGPLGVQRAVDYLLQACEGLAAAHAMGIIHRDIKPENLFVTRQGKLEVVKLLDFGISKVALTGHLPGEDVPPNQTRYVMGTPLYMSPEQIRSDPDLDLRTDIWSMGAVLYELVTGQTAFFAGSITEICANILESSAPRLPRAQADACPALEGVIQRCLEKDPARRYANVAELARALLPLGSSGARAYAARASCILGATELERAIAASSPYAASSPMAAPLPSPASRLAPPAPSPSTDAARGASLKRTLIAVATLMVVLVGIVTLATSRVSPRGAGQPALTQGAALVPTAPVAPAPTSIQTEQPSELAPSPVAIAPASTPEEPEVKERPRSPVRSATSRKALVERAEPSEPKPDIALVSAPRLRLVDAPPSRLRLVEANPGASTAARGNDDAAR